MFKGILIIALSTFSAWLFFFQILIPWIFDRPMFSLFRHPEVRELEEMIAEAKQDRTVDKMSNELEKLRRK